MASHARHAKKKIKKTPRLKDYKVKMLEKVKPTGKKGIPRKRSKQTFQKTWPEE